MRVKFKSIPEMWRKEFFGLKPNTVRIIEWDDLRLDILNRFMRKDVNILGIEIENTETKEFFLRQVTDVTKFNDVYIISWSHE